MDREQFFEQNEQMKYVEVVVKATVNTDITEEDLQDFITENLELDLSSHHLRSLSLNINIKRCLDMVDYPEFEFLIKMMGFDWEDVRFVNGYICVCGGENCGL